MRLLEKKDGKYIVALTAEEAEGLYDACDARNDRLEEWGRGPSGIPMEASAKAKIDEDIRINDGLTRDFQPIISDIREG